METLAKLYERCWSLYQTAETLWLRTAAGLKSPTAGRPQRVRRRRRWAHLAGGVVLGLGLVGQMVALWLVGEAIDLYIAAVELWAELARKHLEITL